MKLKRAGLPLAALLPLLLLAQNLQDFEKKVTEFTLPNGLHFIIYERHQAPVVSFFTYVETGSAQDPSGETGIAHMFEHMAFKGTNTIGTKNYPDERKALAEVEAVYDKVDAERNKGRLADPAKLEALNKELKAAMEKANSYVVPNVYPQIIEQAGGVGLNAATMLDATIYFYNLPSNKAELWFLLESSRFMHPVFREFYKERDVVREELRMRIESSPQGKLVRAFLNTAFASSPYRVGPAGWPSDVENLREKDAVAFFKEYYVPNNMVIAIAGDVNPAEMKRLAEKYFGRLPAGPKPPRLVTKELAQEGPKQVAVYSPSQPLALVGYKRPDQYDKDDPVFDVISDILSSGRTSMMYKELVRDKKICLAAESIATFPGGDYPNLFVLFLAPNSGHTVEESTRAAYAILDQLKTTKVDAETLQRVKTKLRAAIIRGLDSNSGMAQSLATAYAEYGNWRKLFTQLDDINRVTAGDVQRVARQYFTEQDRTVAYTEAPKAESKGEGK